MSPGSQRLRARWTFVDGRPLGDIDRGQDLVDRARVVEVSRGVAMGRIIEAKRETRSDAGAVVADEWSKGREERLKMPSLSIVSFEVGEVW